jgi:hypothetical protein
MTPRGRDYLKASLFGAIVASFLDVRVVLALCLALFIAAGISELILAGTTTSGVRIDLEDPHISCFKESEAVENISIRYKTKRFVRVLVSSVKGPAGIDTAANDVSGSLSLTFKPKFAGRFRGLSVTFEFVDPLGLFKKTLEITRDDFTLDCYPSSLLKNVRQAAPLTLALGERTGRTHGSGQEFYSIDEYTTSVERKNIYWKKIASLPDERLLVKIREANIPQSVSIGLVKTVDRQMSDLEWMDLACEGIGLLGTNIFSIGCDVILLFYSEKSIVRSEAKDSLEFREALMQMSRSQTSDKENSSEILYECDICVTGLKELEDGPLAFEVSKKAALLIKDEDTYPATLGDLSIIYTGSEDLGELVNRVIRR